MLLALGKRDANWRKKEREGRKEEKKRALKLYIRTYKSVRSFVAPSFFLCTRRPRTIGLTERVSEKGGKRRQAVSQSVSQPIFAADFPACLSSFSFSLSSHPKMAAEKERKKISY